MTTSAQVRAAWHARVWTHPDVLAVTPNTLPYDVQVDAQRDLRALYHQTRVNFFTCLVRRSTRVLTMRQALYSFEVRVVYYLQQAEADGSVYPLVRDRLELVDGLVLSALGPDWAGAVDTYSGGDPDDPAAVAVDGKTCWRAALVYAAERKVTF